MVAFFKSLFNCSNRIYAADSQCFDAPQEPQPGIESIGIIAVKKDQENCQVWQRIDEDASDSPDVVSDNSLLPQQPSSTECLDSNVNCSEQSSEKEKQEKCEAYDVIENDTNYLLLLDFEAEVRRNLEASTEDTDHDHTENYVLNRHNVSRSSSVVHASGIDSENASKKSVNSSKKSVKGCKETYYNDDAAVDANSESKYCTNINSITDSDDTNKRTTDNDNNHSNDNCISNSDKSCGSMKSSIKLAPLASCKTTPQLTPQQSADSTDHPTTHTAPQHSREHSVRFSLNLSQPSSRQHTPRLPSPHSPEPAADPSHRQSPYSSAPLIKTTALFSDSHRSGSSNIDG